MAKKLVYVKGKGYIYQNVSSTPKKKLVYVEGKGYIYKSPEEAKAIEQQQGGYFVNPETGETLSSSQDLTKQGYIRTATLEEAQKGQLVYREDVYGGTYFGTNTIKNLEITPQQTIGYYQNPITGDTKSSAEGEKLEQQGYTRIATEQAIKQRKVVAPQLLAKSIEARETPKSYGVTIKAGTKLNAKPIEKLTLTEKIFGWTSSSKSQEQKTQEYRGERFNPWYFHRFVGTQAAKVITPESVAKKELNPFVSTAVKYVEPVIAEAPKTAFFSIAMRSQAAKKGAKQKQVQETKTKTLSEKGALRRFEDLFKQGGKAKAESFAKDIAKRIRAEKNPLLRQKAIENLDEILRAAQQRGLVREYTIENGVVRFYDSITQLGASASPQIQPFASQRTIQLDVGVSGFGVPQTPQTTGIVSLTPKKVRVSKNKRTRTTPLERDIFGVGQATTPITRTTQTTGVTTGLTTDVRTGQGQPTRQTQTPAQTPKQTTETITNLITDTTPTTTQRYRVPKPPRTIGGLPPLFIDYQLKTPQKRRRPKISYGYRPRRAYAPSVGSYILDYKVGGKKAKIIKRKKTFTGLELRPILTNDKRKPRKRKKRGQRIFY